MSEWREFSKRRGEIIRFSVRKILIETETAFQKLAVYDTDTNGRALFLDGKIQSADSDEFIYHESLVHPALILHQNPKRVYICGGGEGATLREALRHNSVETVIMADLDKGVVDASKSYLQTWSDGAYLDPRQTIVNEDARAYLEAQSEPFDAIIVDVTDPLAEGPSYRLFTREFFRLAYDRLTPGGVVSVQAESADIQVLEGHLAIARTVGSVFPMTRAFHTHVPSFLESWGFVVGVKPDGQGNTADPAELSAEEVDSRLASRNLGLSLRFYDGQTHRRLFSSPKYERVLMTRLVDEGAPIISDDQPYTIEY